MIGVAVPHVAPSISMTMDDSVAIRVHEAAAMCSRPYSDRCSDKSSEARRAFGCGASRSDTLLSTANSELMSMLALLMQSVAAAKVAFIRSTPRPLAA